MQTNHWGKWVDSETPITGVHSIYDYNWDACEEEICLDCEQMMADEGDNADADGREPEYDWIECDSSHIKLIGDWTIDTNTNQYTPTLTGEYAAIMRENVIQVVHSKYTEYHALCSPCYPGQADADSAGKYLCYVLPPDLWIKDE